MKQLLIVLALGLFVIGTSSCKKEYTCECVTIQDSTGDTVSTASTTIEATKSDAESSCDGNQTSSGGLTITCNLAD